MDAKELQDRTKQFAIRIVRFVQFLNENGPVVAKVIGNSQFLRSGTGIAANYRAACRAKSRKDFISKIGTVVEEADETLFWLELLSESGMIKSSLINELIKEAKELTAIMTASRSSAIKNREK